MLKKNVVVIGGGAAGVFGAIKIKELHPDSDVIILEKTLKALTKVKISGGGRCNVTHHQFNPKELVKNYPRGQKELLGPFHFFQPQDMISWLESKGVILKTEADGRMFPTTDSSQTIIDCFMHELHRHSVKIIYETEMLNMKNTDYGIIVETNKENYIADALLIATGSTPKNFEKFSSLSLPTISQVPSLFTFHLPNCFLTELTGTSFSYAELKIKGTGYGMIGPLLVTHFGLSGPCALKLSAYAARYLNEKNYEADLTLNVDASTNLQEKYSSLQTAKKEFTHKQISSIPPFGLTKNSFITILKELGIDPLAKWGHTSDKKLEMFAKFCNEMPLKMSGKSTFKEEFVTAGGIDLKYINLKTMEHKLFPRLFFAGEVLDIDGITGGFNFQNAWTTATIAAHGMKNYIKVESTISC